MSSLSGAMQSGTTDRAHGVWAATQRALLHDLAQPLTALSLVLDQADGEHDPALMAAVLRSARAECLRAVRIVQREQVRMEGEWALISHAELQT